MKSCITDLIFDEGSGEELLEDAEEVRVDVFGRRMPTTCSSNGWI
jgi:hypothetical protein